MSDDLVIRPMERVEVDGLVDQAAAEGWNPGLHDADIFWQTDPDAFVAADLEGRAIGGGAITNYAGSYGFMGFFIVQPDHRGKGYGATLWHARKRMLQERLAPGATIGMDGVFEMQDWYARGGFAFSHRQIRFVAKGLATARAPSVVPITEPPFEALLAYDSECFPAPRERFLRAWIEQPDHLALAALGEHGVSGYGVIRRCREGAKIGPLFAGDATTARDLYRSLASFAEGENVYLDVPDNNEAAVAMASQLEMTAVFGTARMYLGPAPRLPNERIFGNTTFELG